jgi:hypothetical protein
MFQTQNEEEREKLIQLLADREAMTRGFQAAVQQALREHKEAGNSVAVWRDGRVVIVSAEEIVLPEEIRVKTEAHERELVESAAG